mmetsp:Transcript_1518/g.9348  ORF Transcript_1518/g.9348 Transcript_1518/m.9348 type:complete len:218 (+) Transcript_1518:151-804(+)
MCLRDRTGSSGRTSTLPSSIACTAVDPSSWKTFSCPTGLRDRLVTLNRRSIVSCAAMQPSDVSTSEAPLSKDWKGRAGPNSSCGSRLNLGRECYRSRPRAYKVKNWSNFGAATASTVRARSLEWAGERLLGLKAATSCFGWTRNRTTVTLRPWEARFGSTLAWLPISMELRNSVFHRFLVARMQSMRLALRYANLGRLDACFLLLTAVRSRTTRNFL